MSAGNGVTSRLRGCGTATTHRVRQVAEAYDQGAIAVIEDQVNYAVIVKFLDTVGVPANIAGLQLAAPVLCATRVLPASP